MKSDIEIAQEAELYPVTEVAKALDMTIDDLERSEERRVGKECRL